MLRRVVELRLIWPWIGLGLLAGCESQPEPGAWTEPDNDAALERPAEVMNVEVRENVIQVPEALTDDVMVMPDRLVFPRSAASEVAMAWPPGEPVIGDRRGAGGAGNNAFGFMRVVTGTRIEGDSVIVETEPAGLFDVFAGEVVVHGDPQKADFVELGGVDPNDFFVGDNTVSGLDLTPGSEAGGSIGIGPEDVAALQQALSLGAGVDISRGFQISGGITAFELDRTITHNEGRANELTVELNGDVSVRGNLNFNPRLWLSFGVETSWSIPPVDRFFEVGMNGQLDLGVRTDFDVEFRVVTEVEGAVEEALEGLPVTSGSALSITLKEGAPIQGPYIGPVPTTFRTELILDCWYELRGGLEGHAEVNVSQPFAVGATWTDSDGFSLGGDNDFLALLNQPTASGQLSGAADAFVECGLMPKVKWLVGGVAGPYLGIRASANARGSFEESCGTPESFTVPADTVASLDVSSRLDVVLGGEIDISILGEGFTFGIGPWSVLGTSFGTLYEDSWTFPQRGYGECIGNCENGVMGEGESDVDCGGMDCLGCRDGQACREATDCLSGICSVDGLCVDSTCRDGRPTPDETDLDCGGPCDPCPFLAMCESHRDCITGICGPNGLCTDSLCFDDVQNGTETDLNCGGNCGGCELGQNCVAGADCLSGSCSTAGVCVDDHCFDGRPNGDETAVDCGGPSCAARCANDASCDGDADCASAICNNLTGLCVGDLCFNNRPDPGEAYTDCGGVCARLCSAGDTCSGNSDCASDICSRGTCAADFCSDGVQGQNETSTDCGGSDCTACQLQRTCIVDTDCVSGLCSGGPNPRCVSDSCRDFRLSAGEADVDCGGVCGALCATGQSCGDAGDCASGICAGGLCVSDPCLDNVRNGTESDIDCGGTCTTLCAEGDTCNGGGDCASGVCNLVARSCVADACLDGVRNGDETDVDCGGSCAADCALNQGCGGGNDCVSGVCNGINALCVESTCFDGILSGGESDVDCGGPCARGCGFGDTCAVDGDCASNTCLGDNTCAIEPCSNGVQDPGETGVDCGGSCGVGCNVGEGCVVAGDCQSTFCSTGMLCVATHCEDGRLSGDESDVDCGGSSCAVCTSGQDCRVPGDCSTGACSIIDNTCVDHCNDGVANFGETDVDCGGDSAGEGCFLRCTAGQGCGPEVNSGMIPLYGHQNCDGGACESGLCQTELPQTCRDAVERFGLAANYTGPLLVDPRDPGSPSISGTDIQNGGPITVYCEPDPLSGLLWSLMGYVRTAGNDPAILQQLHMMGSSVENLSAGDELGVHPTAATLPATHAWAHFDNYVEPDPDEFDPPAPAGAQNTGWFRFTVHDETGATLYDTADGFTTNAPTYPNLRAGVEWGPGQRSTMATGGVAWCSGEAGAVADVDLSCTGRSMRVRSTSRPFMDDITINVPVCNTGLGTCSGGMTVYNQYTDSYDSESFSAGPFYLTFAVWGL